MQLTAKLDYPTLSRSEVIVRTNKQTPLITFTALRYSTPVDKNLRTSNVPCKYANSECEHAADTHGRIIGRVM